jgi:hypothetical protein
MPPSGYDKKVCTKQHQSNMNKTTRFCPKHTGFRHSVRAAISHEIARFQTSLFGRTMAFKTWTDRSIPFDIDTAAHPE